MVEVTRREKEAGIVPDPDVDTYMKVQIIMIRFLVKYFVELIGL